MATCALMAVAIGCWLWARPKGPSYNGQTVKEWFEQFCQHVEARDKAGRQSYLEASAALRELGVDAVPYLAGFITREDRLTRTERWRMNIRGALPKPLQSLIRPPPNIPTLRARAGDALANAIQPPADVLIPWIKPALESTNRSRRAHAVASLRGVSSRRELAMPYVIQALQDANPLTQDGACAVVIHYGQEARMAAPFLVPVITNRLQMTAMHAASALGAIGPDASSVLPDLKLLLAAETDPATRQWIISAIKRFEPSFEPIEPAR